MRAARSAMELNPPSGDPSPGKTGADRAGRLAGATAAGSVSVAAAAGLDAASGLGSSQETVRTG